MPLWVIYLSAGAYIAIMLAVLGVPQLISSYFDLRARRLDRLENEANAERRHQESLAAEARREERQEERRRRLEDERRQEERRQEEERRRQESEMAERRHQEMMTLLMAVRKQQRQSRQRPGELIRAMHADHRRPASRERQAAPAERQWGNPSNRRSYLSGSSRRCVGVGERYSD